MPEAPRPENEAARLAALRGLGILDTPPEERFDRLTRLAQRLFDVPIALVTLIDADRQWFKSCVGLDRSEMPRRIAFCAHALVQDGPLVIPDALRDPRFRDNPLVTGEPAIRFYAGQPLRDSQGHKLGTLCILDRRPREMSQKELEALVDLGVLAENELSQTDLRHALAVQRESEARIRAVMDSLVDGVMTFDGEGVIESFNPAAERMFGDRADEIIGQNVAILMPEVWDGEPPVGGSDTNRAGRAPGAPRHVVGHRKDGTIFPIDLTVSEMRVGDRQSFIAVVRDATERLRAEEALEELRHRNESILNSVGEGIFGLDRHGNGTFVNPAGVRLTGYQLEELIGRHLHSLLHHTRPDGTPLPAQECPSAATLREGAVCHVLDTVFWRKDGSSFPVEYVSTPIREQGQVVGAVVAFKDISERKQAEAGLHQLAAIVSASDEAIISKDLDGTIMSWNPGAERMYGYPADEVIGRSISVIIPPERPDELPAILERLRRGDRIDRYETAWVRKDGRRIDVSLSISPIKDAAGRVTGAASIGRDITDRKQAQAELERQYRAAERARSETRAVLDAASEAIVLVAPDRRLLTVNRRFAEFFAQAPDSVLGRRLDEFQEDIERIFEDPARFFALVLKAGADAERQFTEIVSQRWPVPRELELYSTPVRGAAGEHLGRLYVFRDVTREREVDRMKTEFVSLVSHELRTPLTSIKGYVDLLLDGDVGELAEEQAEFLTIVKNNADRLVALINDLLDISRIESGRIELRRVPLDLAHLIDGVATTLRPQIEAKQQRLALELAEDLPAIRGDPDRITQIFTNLLSNAHKYTPAGGRIAVAARTEDGRVRVDVSDTGVGLSPEEQAQLFTKFFRARNPLTQEVGGTGLGLAITRSLVELHGGAIAVASSPGTGSTFTVTLPATEEAAEIEPATTIVRPGGRILVVDDEPDIAQLIQRYLERGGYQVLVAADGREGMRLARSEQPDLITLDIMLPDVDGLTVLEWLKSDPMTAAIPVVLVSIVADTGNGKLLGAVDYLTKPVQEQVLLERVGRILANDQPRLILVADDDADVRTLLVGHLRRAGYQVIEAADGAEAVGLARRERPGLVLLDVRMPGMDGLTALRELRQIPATRELPVVMMTASPGVLEESRSVVEALGGAAFLSKSCTAEELADALGRVLAPSDRRAE